MSQEHNPHTWTENNNNNKLRMIISIQQMKISKAETLTNIPRLQDDRLEKNFGKQQQTERFVKIVHGLTLNYQYNEL